MLRLCHVQIVVPVSIVISFGHMYNDYVYISYRSESICTYLTRHLASRQCAIVAIAAPYLGSMQVGRHRL